MLSILVALWNQEELVIRALDSVPRRNDLEVVVYDDGSTDNSLAVVKEYQKQHPELRMRIYHSKANRGRAYAMNMLLSKSIGDYFHALDSDDSLITDAYSKLMDKMDGVTDVICFNLRVNSGKILRVIKENEHYYCAQTARFIRRDFANGIKFPNEVKAGSDWYYNEELLNRNPKVIYTDTVAYNYNFPRPGSNVDLKLRGLL